MNKSTGLFLILLPFLILLSIMAYVGWVELFILCLIAIVGCKVIAND